MYNIYIIYKYYIILYTTYHIVYCISSCILYYIVYIDMIFYYQVYYTTKPQLSLSQWESQFVDNNKLTTISDLTPHTIYTIRVEAYTSIGPGPLSNPVQVKTQQGVPSQPSSLNAVEVGSTSIKLNWEQPDHSGENIISYELYWNDTFTPSVSYIFD